MNTNEELKTRPDFEKLAIDFIKKMNYEGSVCVIVAKHGYKTSYEDCWTTHVEPLQAENEQLRKLLHDHNNMCQGKLTEQLNSMLPELRDLKSENQKLRETIESAFIAGRSKTSWKQFQKDKGLI